MRKKKKKTWPTKAAMAQVYAMKLWGGDTYDFYSGEGSHDLKLVAPYIAAVTSFLKSFETPISICDLGCGDFNIGKKLVNYAARYIAVDIVENLIQHNTEKFKDNNLEFQCLDIAVDDLPTADCAIVRQVLQHLSNAEIIQVLRKLKAFKYVILTEHIPEYEFIPNIDIISGQGIRLKKKSGLNVLVSPFNFKVLNEEPLVSLVLNDNKGVIKTVLYTLF